MRFDCNVMFGMWPFNDNDYSLERVIGILEKHQIDKALIASLKGALYNDVDGNDETLSVCRAHDNLYPVGTINPGRFIGADEETARLKEDGFTAVRIFNEFVNLDFSSYVFAAMLKIFQRYSMPLIVNGMDVNFTSCIKDIAKNCADTAMPVIVLDACGYDLSEIIEAAKSVGNLYFSTKGFNTLESIELFCEEVSPERLLFGSGIPFSYGNQSIFKIQSAETSNSVKEDIFSNNLIKLMGERI